MSRVVGIDLGTTFSLVAVVEQGRPRIIAEPAGVPGGQAERLVPSVVGFSKQGELLVGTPAANQYVLEPENTVKSIKRKMGTSETIALDGRPYTPPEISAFILRKLKQMAEHDLGEPVDRAVITVPARFADAARQATRDAGEIAGFEVARIINEPTAAALAYGLDRAVDQKVAVYDLGGGTFDVSIVELSQGVIEVRASHGNTQLGGDDFDQLIVDHLANRFEEQHGLDLRQDRRALARLLRAAERAKITLSDAPYAHVAEEYVTRNRQLLPLHLDLEMARAAFEEMIGPLIRSTLDAVDRALQDARLRPRDLDKVLLVGGSTRIPLVRRLLAEHLGQEPHADVHPDEAVALGAAVQGAIVAGEPVEAVLVDVAPYSLGIETMQPMLDYLLGDRYHVVIPRNTAIPCSKAESFYTLTPQQDKMRVRAYQGEEPVASRNTRLGEFLFEGISPSPAGHNREVVVRFDYDLDGIVQVSAIDRRTNRSEAITVTTTRERLSETEKAASMAKLTAVDRRLEREITALLRRAERAMTRLEAEGQSALAEQVLTLAGDLERTRQRRDYDQARVLAAALGDLIYGREQ